MFRHLTETWGRLDIALHSIAFAPRADLQGRLVDSSAEGFGMAMDVSCHSFIRMARLAEPLMKGGGTLLAMSYHGANKVVPMDMIVVIINHYHRDHRHRPKKSFIDDVVVKRV